MRRLLFMVLACGLALNCLGCAKDDATSNATSSAGAPGESAVTGDFTLVSTKMPNMT